MPPITRRGFAGLLLAGSAAALPGCAGLFQEPPKLYTLTPANTFDANLPNVTWQLLIAQPVAPAGLDTERIALRDSPVTLDYFAGVAWTDRMPLMVQTLLIESFDNSGRIVSIGRDTVGLRADYLLRTELRDFQADYSGADGAPPSVLVRMNAKLVSFPSREIVAGDSFEALVPAASPQFESIIRAFDEALGMVMRRIVEWTLVQGQSDWRTHPRRS